MSAQTEVRDLIDTLGLDGAEAVAHAALALAASYPGMGKLIAAALDEQGHHLIAHQIERFAATATRTEHRHD